MLSTAPENSALWWALVVVNIPVYVFLCRKIFKDLAGLKAAALAGFRPNLFFRESFWNTEEGWVAGKFWAFFLGCALLVVLEYELIARLLLGGSE